jgi:hypothetical protein
MTELLSKEDKERFLKEVSGLKQILKNIVEIYKKNLLLFNKTRTNHYSAYLLDIIARFRYNSESLENLMDVFSKDYRLKISVNLILRSIAADQLTALYLLTFYDDKDNSLEGLKNELNVISAESLHFVKKTMKEDHELLVELKLEKPEDFDKKQKWFENLAPDLLENNGKIKGKKKLRETTPEHIKDGINNQGAFLTESQKHEHIKEKGFADYGFIFIAFKYYSQFQHFNLMSKKFIENEPLHDTFYMALTLDHMLMTTDMLLQISKSTNPNFKNEMSELRKEIKKHFS